MGSLGNWGHQRKKVFKMVISNTSQAEAAAVKRTVDEFARLLTNSLRAVADHMGRDLNQDRSLEAQQTSHVQLG